MNQKLLSTNNSVPKIRKKQMNNEMREKNSSKSEPYKKYEDSNSDQNIIIRWK